VRRAHGHDDKEHSPLVQLEGEDDVSAERYSGSTVSQTCFNLVRTQQGLPAWPAQLSACCHVAMGDLTEVLCPRSMCSWGLASSAAHMQCGLAVGRACSRWPAQRHCSASAGNSSWRGSRRSLPTCRRRIQHWVMPLTNASACASKHCAWMPVDPESLLLAGCRASGDGQLRTRPSRCSCHDRVLWCKCNGKSL